jgi:hypothetical protein
MVQSMGAGQLPAVILKRFNVDIRLIKSRIIKYNLLCKQNKGGAVMKSGLKIVFMLIFLILCYVPVVSAEESKGSVTFTYKLEKISKKASNQIALWIEDESSKYVKTVFATRFTAQGGFKKRPQALSEWTKTSDWINATRDDVDAVSGPTQMAGMNNLIWDCTDSSGKPVAPGTYVYKMEGNLFWDNRVLWEGRITVGKEQNSSVGEPKFLLTDSTEKSVLVEQLKAVFEPSR